MTGSSLFRISDTTAPLRFWVVEDYIVLLFDVSEEYSRETRANYSVIDIDSATAAPITEN